MKDPQLNAEAIDAPTLIHKPRRIRPARWAWKLGGLEFSRVELVKTWQTLNTPPMPRPVYFHEGRGCSTAAAVAGKPGRKVRTLRELLQVARIDYINISTNTKV